MRLIDADDLDEKGIEFTDTNVYVPIEAIWNAPTIEAEPVVHGEWAHLGGDEWCCTECGNVITTEGSWEKPTRKFCDECGAKMKGANDETNKNLV